MSDNKVKECIIKLKERLEAALKCGDLENAKILSDLLAQLPSQDVERSLNPIDPDIQNAGKQLLERTIHTFVEEPETGFVRFRALVQCFQIPNAVAKAMIKPVILEVIRETTCDDMRDKDSRLEFAKFLDGAREYF